MFLMQKQNWASFIACEMNKTCLENPSPSRLILFQNMLMFILVQQNAK